MLGPNAKGLSATTISRLKADWWEDYQAWQKRDLSTRRFLYVWTDEYGHKEFLGMTDGFRESTQSPLSWFASKPLLVNGMRALG